MKYLLQIIAFPFRVLFEIIGALFFALCSFAKLLLKVLTLGQFQRKPDGYFENLPRKWGMMPTLDYYVFREFMIKFSVLLLVFVILFLLGDVFNDFSDFLEKKTPLVTAASYFLLKLPGNVRFILPIAVLLGCMWTMAAFGKNLEVTAMRASGVSLIRCGGTIFMMGLIVTGVNIYFNERLVPITEREAEVLRQSALTGKPSAVHEMLTYRSPDKRRTWLFKSFDLHRDKREIILKSFRADGTLEWDMTAGKARFANQKGWTFENVSLTPYSQDGLMPGSPQMHKTVTKSMEDIPETPRDILNAIRDVDDLPVWVIWSIIQRAQEMPDRLRAGYMTAFYYRLAFPWACFLAVFLGVPLATRNERSGIMLSIITAIVAIVGYIVVAQICLVLGKRGILPPMVAGLAPTVAFILFGYYKLVFNRA